MAIVVNKRWIYSASAEVCCEAVQSAILATAWLLV